MLVFLGRYESELETTDRKSIKMPANVWGRSGLTHCAPLRKVGGFCPAQCQPLKLTSELEMSSIFAVGIPSEGIHIHSKLVGPDGWLAENQVVSGAVSRRVKSIG